MENKNKLTEEKLRHLINQNESEVLEFKVDNTSSQKIGQYVSALANSAQCLANNLLIWFGEFQMIKKLWGQILSHSQKK